MKFRFLVPVLLFVALSATAASIGTSVTCQAGSLTVTGTTGCEAYSGLTFAEAFLDDSVWRAGYDYGFRATTSSRAQSYEQLNSARSSLTLTRSLSTQGPVRNGWIDLFIRVSGDFSPGGSGWGRVEVGPYSGSYIDGRFSFPLGVPFLLTIQASSSASAGGGEYAVNSSTGWADVNVYYRVWEADLSRRVSVQDPSVPEPAGTAVIGLLGLVSLRLIRGNRRK